MAFWTSTGFEEVQKEGLHQNLGNGRVLGSKGNFCIPVSSEKAAHVMSVKLGVNFCIWKNRMEVLVFLGGFFGVLLCSFIFVWGIF